MVFKPFPILFFSCLFILIKNERNLCSPSQSLAALGRYLTSYYPASLLISAETDFYPTRNGGNSQLSICD